MHPRLVSDPADSPVCQRRSLHPFPPLTGWRGEPSCKKYPKHSTLPSTPTARGPARGSKFVFPAARFEIKKGNKRRRTKHTPCRCWNTYAFGCFFLSLLSSRQYPLALWLMKFYMSPVNGEVFSFFLYILTQTIVNRKLIIINLRDNSMLISFRTTNPSRMLRVRETECRVQLNLELRRVNKFSYVTVAG